MKYDAQLFRLEKNEEIAKGIFDFVLYNPQLSEITKEGQFAHVKVGNKTLRRPISICDADNERIRLVFQVKGEGTEILSKAKVGDELDIICPLGHGFDIQKGKKYCLIGGGIGVPPMLYCAKTAENPVVITGFRNKDLVILQDDFKKYTDEVYLVTDDGTAGEKGFVTDVLKKKIDEVDEVCACGPMVMLKAIAEICKEKGKPCQVSLEERMGCGIGACLVCACKTRTGESGEEEYTHVCKKGPVYKAEEVVF